MDDAARPFLDAFDRHWDVYRRQFKAARRDPSEDAVHDLRVAARRFLAVLEILRSLDTHPRVKRLRRFLKRQLDQLDELRDTQVLRAQARQDAQAFPQLALFEAHLEGRLEKLTRRAGQELRSPGPSDLKADVRQARRVAARHSADTHLTDRLAEAVDAAHARTLRAFGDLDSQDPAGIHRVRVAFKRLRYMIETVAPLLPRYPQDRLEHMHAYQDAMGRVHDAAVLLERLRAFAGQAPGFEAGPVEAHYEQQLRQLVRAYLDRKDEFGLFWRAAPHRPFPWEQSHEPLHRASRHRRAAGAGRQRPGRQPAAPDRAGTEEVPADRQGPARPGRAT